MLRVPDMFLEDGANGLLDALGEQGFSFMQADKR
jgi:hypothetical protein